MPENKSFFNKAPYVNVLKYFFEKHMLSCRGIIHAETRGGAYMLATPRCETFFKKNILVHLLKIRTFLIYLYAIAVPLVYLTASKSVFSMPKLISLRLITSALIIVLIIELISSKKLPFIKHFWNKILLIYSFFLLINTIFSEQIYASLFGIHSRFVGLISLLNLIFISWAASQLLNVTQIRRLIYCSVATATLLALIGVLQHYGVISGENWSNNPQQRAFATIEHGNHYGAYLVFHMMLLWGLVFEKKSRSGFLIGFTISLISLAAIIFTGSRAALLSLFLAALVFLLLSRPFQFFKKISAKPLIPRLVLIGVLAIIALSIVIIITSSLRQKISQTTLIARTQETINFIRAGNIPDRISWLLSSADMFRDHPFFGHGLATFKDKYNLYRRRDYRNPHDSQDTITPEAAHNEYANILVEQGLIGFLIWIFLVAYPLYAAYRYLKSTAPPHKWLVIGLSAALSSYLIQIFFNFGVITTLTIFYLFLGALLKVIYAEKQTLSKISPFPANAYIVSALLFVIILIYFSQKQFYSELNYRTAENAFRDQNYPLALAAASQMTEAFPYEYVYFQTYGDYLYETASINSNREENINLIEEGIFAYQKAVNISPRQPYLHANLGLAYYLYSSFLQTPEKELNIDRAVTEYQTAVKFSPNNPLYLYNYAYLLTELQHFPEAITAYQQILEIREDYSDSAYLLAKLYIQVRAYREAIELLKYEEQIGRGNPQNNTLWETADQKLRQLNQGT